MIAGIFLAIGVVLISLAASPIPALAVVAFMAGWSARLVRNGPNHYGP